MLKLSPTCISAHMYTTAHGLSHPGKSLEEVANVMTYIGNGLMKYLFIWNCSRLR